MALCAVELLRRRFLRIFFFNTLRDFRIPRKPRSGKTAMHESPRDLVEPEWLLEHLQDPAVRIVDCRFSLADAGLGRRQYAEGHIPGAIHADLQRDLSGTTGPHTGRHPLPDVEVLERRLAAWGISSQESASHTFVVAYDDSNLMFAARLWWMLKYLGHDRVAVLNAPWSAWAGLGLPVATAVPAYSPGSFTARLRPGRVVDHAGVRQALGRPGVALMDARSPQRYRGLEEPIDPVAGTIPGSQNYFAEAVLDDSGRMRSAEWLADYWRALDDTEESIAFCGSGVAACLNLLSQAVAGREPSKLYVGGWSEWCRRSCRASAPSNAYPDIGESP
jgi:thiosulfate/3-mercaptopyruvate sulfurtransferase